MHPNAAKVRALFDHVWNNADYDALDELVADAYTVVSDPGDPWDGQTLTREGFRERAIVSKRPFPDLHFELGTMLADDANVAVAWTMTGTNSEPLGPEMPATGNRISARGLTIYHLEHGRITGHTQVTDRLAVMMQLGILS